MYSSWQAYVVNLDRAPERMATMREKLDRAGIPFTRVSGVDGKKVQFTAEEVDEKGYIHDHGKYVTPTEVGCYMSHVKVLEQFLADGYAAGLVMEDDATAAPELVAAVEELMRYPAQWDVVKFAGPDSGSRRWPIEVAKLEHGVLTVNMFFHSSTAAYLVNRRAAKKYLAHMLPMRLPWDHEFMAFWKYGLRHYTYFPLLAQPEILGSTIDYAQVKSNRLPQWKRLPTHWYRFKKMVKRLYYGWLLVQRGRREWRQALNK